MPGWEVSPAPATASVHDDGSLVLYVDRGATALSFYVRYLSTDMLKVVPPASRLQRLAHQGENVVPIQSTGKEVPRGSRGPPCPVPRQEVLRILPRRLPSSSRDVQQQVVCLAGIGRSHVAFIATVRALPDNPAPMMAIRLIASSFSPRFFVFLVVVLKAQAVPRRQRRPVLTHYLPGCENRR